MTDAQIQEIFGPLWADLVDENDFPSKRPLLAHYTSLPALEKILQTEEVWFSNPLAMNDLDEVRFGILRGNELFHASSSISKACGTPERHSILRDAYVTCSKRFEDEHAIDTYVFCLSEHDPLDGDGLLSMWRGYGGNGTGAAIVFDTAKLTVKNSSPLIFARVHYASEVQRLKWLADLMNRFAALLAVGNIPDDMLYGPAHYLFERIKLFALFSKHDGFHEEKEWRVVYAPDRDVGQLMAPMFHYSLGSRGAELRLKYKIAPLEGVSAPDFSFENLVERILLGPTISGILAQKAVVRMLEKAGRSALINRVHASSIPFRLS
jgi:Protein of unknown function (DUF2971)